ncbi:MAG TPA: hypothetical protein VFI31_04370 [Pirellulales bacterium]|nr:hypothetical protein [Pirellulales bacterium]
MNVCGDEIDFIHCQNGALLIESAGDRFTLSQQQLKILMFVCGEDSANNSGCTRGELHVAALGHRPLPRGRTARGSERRRAVKLSAAQRAALSRSLRRLADRGLIVRSRVQVAPTALGAALMRQLRSNPGWKSWRKHCLRAVATASTPAADKHQ